VSEREDPTPDEQPVASEDPAVADQPVAEDAQAEAVAARAATAGDPAEPRPDAEPAAEAAASDASSPVVDTGGGAVPAHSVAEAEEGSVLPPAQIRAALEALVFASPQPITPKEISRVLEGVRKEDWQRELEALRADYSRDERGLQVIEVAGGFQITTRPEYNDWVRELLDPRTPTRLSIQALETLAVIAYKQPVTLPEIIELRGVKSGGVVKTLLEKRLIRITGRKEVVGRPILYGTTKQFFLHFGLKDLTELPKIEEFAEVLGEEVDVAGLKRAIESPLPVQVGLSDPDGEQIPLFEGPAAPPGQAAEPDEPGSEPEGEGGEGEDGALADDATGELFAGESEGEAGPQEDGNPPDAEQS
jgi:segregation and condensation protein B